MKYELLYVFTGEEVVQKLGALYIAETTKRCIWNTFRAKRLRKERLKDIDPDIIKVVISKAVYFYSHGVPKEYKCTGEVYSAWVKLFMTCAEIDMQSVE